MHLSEYQGLHGSCSGWVWGGCCTVALGKGVFLKGCRVAGFPIKAHRDWRSVSDAQRKRSLWRRCGNGSTGWWWKLLATSGNGDTTSMSGDMETFWTTLRVILLNSPIRGYEVRIQTHQQWTLMLLSAVEYLCKFRTMTCNNDVDATMQGEDTRWPDTSLSVHGYSVSVR